MDKRRPTIMDVAKLAGVSHQTVSRVINGQQYVRAQTRARVVAAIDELSYQPSAVAQRLAGGRSRSIGVISTGTPLFGPSQTLHKIESGARSRGYSVGVFDLSTDDSSPPSASALRDAVGALQRQQVAGLAVLTSIEFDTTVFEILARTTPIVLVDAESTSALPFTSIDQFEGGALAARHLIGLRHRKIVTLSGPSNWHDAQLRAKGWLATLLGEGVVPVARVDGDWTSASGFAAVSGLAEIGVLAGVHYTALLAGNDSMALGAMRFLHSIGVAIPDGVSIVGFDDIPEAAYFEPPLTTVVQDFGTLGRRCVEQLIALIENPDLAPRVQMITPTLVARASTAAVKPER